MRWSSRGVALTDLHADALALLSANLHRLMDEQRVSARELCRKSGVMRPVVYRVLQFPNRGPICNPSLQTVSALAHALGVSVGSLLSPHTSLP